MDDSDWDPTKDKESNSLAPMATMRIKRDILDLVHEAPPGIFIFSDETNLKFASALIIGPEDTPYEGGFFYFMLKFPNSYPMEPPRVKLLTTDAGNVRFNPNLYSNGKVCVSILGTFSGPSWSPAQQLSSLLVAIQSLLTENPYYNEPGLEEVLPGDCQRYNEIIRYETLRVAVCGMVENECRLNIPEPLKDTIKKTFLKNYHLYSRTIDEKMRSNGRLASDPITKKRVQLDYASLKKRIVDIHKKVSAEVEEEEREAAAKEAAALEAAAKENDQYI